MNKISLNKQKEYFLQALSFMYRKYQKKDLEIVDSNIYNLKYIHHNPPTISANDINFNLTMKSLEKEGFINYSEGGGNFGNVKLLDKFFIRQRPENKEEIKSHESHTREKPETATKTLNEAYDVFMCHSSEDKESFVEPLATALHDEGINVWYDNFEIKWGGSIRASVDRGLAKSKFGIVVFSKAFFEKETKWTEHELNGLFAKETNGKTVILPILHNVSIDELKKYYPAFSDRLAIKSDSIPEILKCIKERLDNV